LEPTRSSAQLRGRWQLAWSFAGLQQENTENFSKTVVPRGGKAKHHMRGREGIGGKVKGGREGSKRGGRGMEGRGGERSRVAEVG